MRTREQLEHALEESVTLQAHYAGLLNQHDGGERIEFKNAEEWMERLEIPPDQRKGREPEFDCPSENCEMCSGEACWKCGAGCWDLSVTDCKHDVCERHEDPEDCAEMEATCPLREHVKAHSMGTSHDGYRCNATGGHCVSGDHCAKRIADS